MFFCLLFGFDFLLLCVFVVVTLNLCWIGSFRLASFFCTSVGCSFGVGCIFVLWFLIGVLYLLFL